MIETLRYICVQCISWWRYDDEQSLQRITIETNRKKDEDKHSLMPTEQDVSCTPFINIGCTRFWRRYFNGIPLNKW